jgi:hypothetical protein
MRFYTAQPPLYCGLDLPARPMDLCFLPHDGASLVPRHRPAGSAPFSPPWRPPGPLWSSASPASCPGTGALRGWPLPQGHKAARGPSPASPRMPSCCGPWPWCRRRSRLWPTPWPCSSPSRAAGSACVSSWWRRGRPAPAAHGGRLVGPLAASSQAPRQRPESAMAPLARRAAPPLSRGPGPPHPACGPKVSGPLRTNPRDGHGRTGFGASAGPGGL